MALRDNFSIREQSVSILFRNICDSHEPDHDIILLKFSSLPFFYGVHSKCSIDGSLLAFRKYLFVFGSMDPIDHDRLPNWSTSNKKKNNSLEKKIVSVRVCAIFAHGVTEQRSARNEQQQPQHQQTDNRRNTIARLIAVQGKWIRKICLG